MRVLYFHQYFRTPAMPGGTRSYEIARRLVARGHDVHIVTSDQDPESNTIRVTTEQGIQVTWIPVKYSNKLNYSARILAFLKYAAFASDIGLNWRPDVIFATSTPLTIGIPAIIASRHWKAPMIFEVRDLWPDVPIAMGALRNPLSISLARRLERLCYQSASHIIALSPGMKDGILKTGWADASSVSIIPNLTNRELARTTEEEAARLLRELNLPSGQKIVLYAGTLGRVNNVTYLAELAFKLQRERPNILFLVVGDGAERTLVERKARELGILDTNFFLRDPIPKAKIGALFKAASLAVSTVANIPELFDNSANKFFDAIAAHVPVAINHGGWLADLIRKNALGVVLPREIDEAAAILRDFLDDPWRQKEARRNAARISEEFSADVAAQKIEHIMFRAYNREFGIIEQGRSPSAFHHITSLAAELDT